MYPGAVVCLRWISKIWLWGRGWVAVITTGDYDNFITHLKVQLIWGEPNMKFGLVWFVRLFFSLFIFFESNIFLKKISKMSEIKIRKLKYIFDPCYIPKFCIWFLIKIFLHICCLIFKKFCFRLLLFVKWWCIH